MNLNFRFKLKTLIDSNNKSYLIPDPLKQFFFDYNHSKFIECRYDLTTVTRKIVGQDQAKNKRIMMSLKYLIDILEGMYKPYAILEGTLLGNIYEWFT